MRNEGMRVAAESPGVDYVAQWCRIPTSWSSSRFMEIMRVAGPKKGPDCLFGVVPGRRYNYQALQLSGQVRSGVTPVSSGPSMGTRTLAKLDVRTIGPHCYTIQS